jgi:hypothetical protein
MLEFIANHRFYDKAIGKINFQQATKCIKKLAQSLRTELGVVKMIFPIAGYIFSILLKLLLIHYLLGVQDFASLILGHCTKI